MTAQPPLPFSLTDGVIHGLARQSMMADTGTLHQPDVDEPSIEDEIILVCPNPECGSVNTEPAESIHRDAWVHGRYSAIDLDFTRCRDCGAVWAE